MFRFSFPINLTLVFLMFSSSSLANDPIPPLPPKIYQYWTASFTSWTELMDIENETVADHAFGNFYGAGIGRSVEQYSRGPIGTISEFSILSGQFNAGGTQQVLIAPIYKTTHQSWWGAQASLRLAYRLGPQVVLSIGPTALFRNAKFPEEGTNYMIKSGADLNLGAIGEIRFRLTDKLELHQTFGTLAFKASTVWSFGLGYTF